MRQWSSTEATMHLKALLQQQHGPYSVLILKQKVNRKAQRALERKVVRIQTYILRYSIATDIYIW